MNSRDSRPTTAYTRQPEPRASADALQSYTRAHHDRLLAYAATYTKHAAAVPDRIDRDLLAAALIDFDGCRVYTTAAGRSLLVAVQTAQRDEL